MKNIKILFAVLFILGTFAAYADDEPDDDIAAGEVSAEVQTFSEQTPAQQYESLRAEAVQRQYLDHGRSKAMMEAVYEDNVIFDVYRGNGDEVKLSELADEMGNKMLADRLRIGECYYGFMGGFAACTATTGVLVVLGIAFTVFRNGFDFEMYEYCSSEGINEYMTSAIVMFSVSAVTLIGSIVLGICLYKAYQYKLNIIQARSLINQYNKFLQKKIGFTPDVSYHERQLGLTFKIAL